MLLAHAWLACRVSLLQQHIPAYTAPRDGKACTRRCPLFLRVPAVCKHRTMSLAGCRVADWFAQMNNKMGGDLKKIQVGGREGCCCCDCS